MYALNYTIWKRSAIHRNGDSELLLPERRGPAFCLSGCKFASPVPCSTTIRYRVQVVAVLQQMRGNEQSQPAAGIPNAANRGTADACGK